LLTYISVVSARSCALKWSLSPAAGRVARFDATLEGKHERAPSAHLEREVPTKPWLRPNAHSRRRAPRWNWMSEKQRFGPR
jgi:hypothetical protein